MTASFRQQELGIRQEAFGCLADLVCPRSFTAVVGKAIRKWGEGMLELAGALGRELDAALEENARLRSRIAELERSAALDSSNSSKPPTSDGRGQKKGKRTESERARTGRPSGGQPGHKGTTLEQAATPDRVVDHDPTACSGCGAPLSDADRQAAPPPVGRSSTSPSRAPSRSPNIAPTAAAVAPAPP